MIPKAVEVGFYINHNPLADSQIDLKEAFNISEEPDELEQEAPTNLNRTPYPTSLINHWPSQPIGFRSILSQYRQACFKFSQQLLKLIALSLDLDENYFWKLNSIPMAGLRLLHYPSQEIATDIGLGAHTDYSCTLHFLVAMIEMY